jgi:hypothetical protein
MPILNAKRRLRGRAAAVLAALFAACLLLERSPAGGNGVANDGGHCASNYWRSVAAALAR